MGIAWSRCAYGRGDRAQHRHPEMGHHEAGLPATSAVTCILNGTAGSNRAINTRERLADLFAGHSVESSILLARNGRERHLHQPATCGRLILGAYTRRQSSPSNNAAKCGGGLRLNRRNNPTHRRKIWGRPRAWSGTSRPSRDIPAASVTPSKRSGKQPDRARLTPHCTPLSGPQFGPEARTWL